MEPIISDYLNKFEQRLRSSLRTIAISHGRLRPVASGADNILESEDIMGYWHKVEANYMADAVPQIAAYPTVSVAWALYLGMAVAQHWDADWTSHSDAPYESYYGDQGFDNMDDHIVRDILLMPLQRKEAQSLISVVQSLAQETVSLIRHEQIEPQSKMAFYVFARACNAMYAIGAAMQLTSLGYVLENVK